MKTESIKILITRSLLTFVLITIGFAIGRRTAPVLASNTEELNKIISVKKNKIIIYSAHMTFRCPECNQIEWFTRELINSEFTDEVKKGNIEFHSVDYMSNTEFTARYNISSSTIVISIIEDDKEVDFDRLDQVWTKVKNREEFFEYVRSAINKSLSKEK